MGDALPVIDLGVGRTAKRVSSAANHACAILDDDTLKCWGRGLDGGLGYGDTTNRGDSAGSMGASLPAVDLGTGKLAQEVMCCKPSNTCVILTDGTVKCFGSNVYGQLGYGDTTTRGDSPTSMGDNLPAVDLGTGRTALQIGCGYEVHCALLDNGAVKCWGYGLYGLLGQETETNAGNLANTMGDFLPPINLGTGRTATSIGVAGYMVCAILDNSDLKCWGEGTSGQLGYGDASRRGSYANTMGDFLPAVDMGTGRTATKVRCGNLYWGCAVLDDDSVKCWGTGGAQQGQGDTSLRGSSSNTMGDFLPPIDLGTAPVTVTTTTLTATTSTKTSVTTTGTTSSGTITSTSTWTSTSSSTSISATSTVTSSTTETFSSTSSSTSITSTDTTTSSSTTVSSTTSSSATASSTTTSSATASSTTTSSATVSSTTTSSATTSSTTTTSTSASSSTTGSATFSSTTTSSTSLSITTSSSVTITSSSSSSSSSSISGTTSTTVSQTTTSRSTSSSITSSSSTSSSSSSSSSSSVSGTSSATFTSTSTSLSSTRSSSSSATISSTGTTTPEGNTTTTSVTPLNQEEFDKLEQLREEQAQAAVASLDASEEEAVNQTLQLLSALIADSQNSTDGVLAEASITTDAGTLKVVALSAETMSNGSNVSIGTEEGTSILVPQAVLAQAASVAGSGIVLLSVTTLSENITDKIRSDDARLGRRLDTQGSTLAGQSISLNFRGADGARLAINNLASPMELTLAVNEENATCAYFDEETLTWSTEGVETVGTSSGQVICRTSHLSIFGGILEFILADVAKVLKCSSAGDLLSAQGVSKLAELQWLAYGTSVVVFVSLFIFSLAFCFAVRLDTKVSKAIPWEHKEPVLLRTKASVAEILETEDDKASKSCCDRMKENLESSVEWFLWGIGLCFGYENLAEVVKEFLPNAPESTVNRCITTIHAHKTGTSRDSIDGVKKMSKSFSRTKSLSTSNVLEPADDPVPEDMGDRRSTSFSKRALPSSIVGKMDAFHSKHSVGLLDYQEIQEHGAKAVKSFVSSTWMTRILLLFPALHPWLETVRFSLFTSHTTRTALIITKLTSAAAVGALFFSSTSFTSSSDPDCAPPTNLLSQMIQAATVGLLSAFFGDTVIFVLFIIQSRQAVDKNEWKPREKERLLWRWRCKSTLFLCCNRREDQ
ncbi:HERC2 [Symbiodinium natans]|uniref:HERC2 protein n=1 Tax=Symbiodinium natans TaxID=878477 RepID=A0A812I909_9DINO|nr:HERC2 [Symbiodinium natans]